MSKGRRYAVLIGSNSFDKEPKLTPLKCPGNDVDGMREILAAAELGAFEDPFVFKNAESHVVARRIGKVLAEASNHDDCNSKPRCPRTDFQGNLSPPGIDNLPSVVG